MKFIISESSWDYFSRMAYRGVIGLFYDDTLSGLLAYLIFGLLVIFAAIGIVATIKWIFTHKKKKRPY